MRLGWVATGGDLIKQRSPGIGGRSVEFSKDWYGELKRLLLGLEEEVLGVLTRTPYKLINRFDFLTSGDVRRIPLDICLCAPSPVSVVACPQRSLFGSPTSRFDSTRISLCCFFIAQLFRLAHPPHYF